MIRLFFKQGVLEHFLPLWKIECNDRINARETSKFLSATKTNNDKGNTRANNLTLRADSFIYLETNGINYGQNFIVSFERIDFIQTSIINFS